jgi:uncharacterized protein
MPSHVHAPFSIGAITAAPGSVAAGTLDVPPAAGDAGTTIPISIIHGAAPGPILALVAGVHGMEYVPIVALQHLRHEIDPLTLRGTIIMVHVANMPSFLGRTIYYSPVDGHNLNRVFPGKPEGTLSERIAHVITDGVIHVATHVVDLHGGDGNESLRPYAYWITTGQPEVVKASRALALAFGLDRIVVDDERPTDAARSVYLSNTALTRGKPAITTETGCLARVDDEAMALLERGVRGVLRHLGMCADGPAPVEQPQWLTRNLVLRASHTGLFYASVERGVTIEKDHVLGRVTDFHGAVLETIAAPFDGEVLYIVDTPPINRGEPVAMVSAM